MIAPPNSVPEIEQTEEEIDVAWDDATYDPDAEPITERRIVIDPHEAPTIPTIEVAKKASS